MEGWLGMDKVREILRLRAQGLNQSQIARACATIRATVRDYIRMSQAADISYEQLCKLSEQEVKECFGKKPAGRRSSREELDCAAMHKELKRKGVTLQLL